MAGPPSHGDPGDDTGAEPDDGSTPGTPRWVKVFGIVALVAVLVFVVLILTGRGGGHGPGRHTVDAGHAQPARVTQHGAQQP